MKQIILNVPESQFSFFMKLVRSLKFVQVAEPAKTAEELLSSEQKKTWNNVKQGFEEFELVKQGKTKARPLQNLLDEF